MLTAEEFLGDGPFVMYLGDNLLRDGITDLVDAFRAHEPDALILLTRVPDPGNYGVAELDGERVVRLVEKPEDPPSDFALVGVYMFGPPIFEAARAIEPSGRGELEITDAIQRLIDGGKQVESRTVNGWWKDTGQLADMLEANRLVLEDIERADRRRAGGLRGRGAGGGRGGREARAGGGPRTGDHRRRRADRRRLHRPLHGDRRGGRASSRSEVEHSILLAGVERHQTSRSRMEASLLGRDVKLSRGDGLPKTLRMIVGDNAEITIP